MDAFLQFYIPIFYIVYILIAFALPTYRVWKTTGINPITFSKSDNAHDYIGGVFKVLLLAVFIEIGIQCFFPAIMHNYLLPMNYLNNPIFRVIGLVIIHLSCIWTIIAQYQMNKSWRIGIDEQNKTELVSTGTFAYSRNPIFLGMLITLTGLFFISPNGLSFCILIVSFVILQIQVRLEEDFLIKIHGDIYRAYKKSTRRWL